MNLILIFLAIFEKLREYYFITKYYMEVLNLKRIEFFNEYWLPLSQNSINWNNNFRGIRLDNMSSNLLYKVRGINCS